jgi:hypothetical protein
MKLKQALKLLNDLFEQADEDTPSEYRSRHFKETLEEVENFLVENKIREVVPNFRTEKT